MEAGDLFFTAVAEAEGLQGAGAHGKYRIESVALTEQELALFQRAAAFYDVVQRIHVFQIQR
ncbi:hypothetical protein D3C86_2232300 [compost metagenome]